MRWTVERSPRRCGAAGCTIQPDEPVALFAGGRIVRCAQHAAELGYPVAWQEIELERFRLEQEIARAAAARLSRPTSPPAPVIRVPARPPKPAAVVGDLFDPKLAAAGRDD